ncbi:MAG: hypothetical protein ABIH66_07870 [bacterium]
MKTKMFVAIDPGRHKCGVAVMDGDGGVVEKLIVRRDALGDEIKNLLSRHPGVEAFAVGSGTGGGGAAALLRENFPGIGTSVVEEKDTTRLAKERFFRENPGKRYLGIFPLSLFLPQPEVDEYAAVVIGERFLKSGGL